MIEAKPGLIDYWHDQYLKELGYRYQIAEVLKLPVTVEEKFTEIERIVRG